MLINGHEAHALLKCHQLWPQLGFTQQEQNPNQILQTSICSIIKLLFFSRLCAIFERCSKEHSIAAVPVTSFMIKYSQISVVVLRQPVNQTTKPCCHTTNLWTRVSAYFQKQ